MVWQWVPTFKEAVPPRGGLVGYSNGWKGLHSTTILTRQRIAICGSYESIGLLPNILQFCMLMQTIVVLDDFVFRSYSCVFHDKIVVYVQPKLQLFVEVAMLLYIMCVFSQSYINHYATRQSC